MTEAIAAGHRPCLVRFAKAGDSFLWCACGRSARQPYCDGSHKGTGIDPLRVTSRVDGEEALLCVCKRTTTPPYCDGSHNSLAPDSAAEDSAFAINWESAILAAPTEISSDRAELDGGCFVLTPPPGAGAVVNGWRILQTIGTESAASFLSQYFLQPIGPNPKPIGFGDAEVALFVCERDAIIEIGGRRIAAPLHSAVTVLPDETFVSVSNEAVLIATVCPGRAFKFDGAGRSFDEAFSERVGRSDQAARERTGDRFYQLLSSRENGAVRITQFVGGVPRSRAAPHRHLYEEALVILSGAGVMWTEHRKAKVNPGDIIYLPRKQVHSLECVSNDGMVLAGSFYPAGSPAINY